MAGEVALSVFRRIHGEDSVGIIQQLEFADAESENLPKPIVDINLG